MLLNLIVHYNKFLKMLYGWILIVLPCDAYAYDKKCLSRRVNDSYMYAKWRRMRCAYNCSWWNHVANCCSDDCIVYSLCATGCGDGCSNGCAVLLELALPQLQEQIDCNDVATCIDCSDGFTP